MFTAADWLLVVPSQLQLLGFSPSLKGQETESHRYGIFGQRPSQMTASTSERDNKENMAEVSSAVEHINENMFAIMLDLNPIFLHVWLLYQF